MMSVLRSSIALIGCLLASASALAEFVAPLLAPATPILDIHAVLPQPNRQAIAVAVVGGRFVRFELDGNPLTPSARERFGVRHAFSTSEVRATPEGSFWQLHSPDTGFIAPPGFNQGIQFEWVDCYKNPNPSAAWTCLLLP